MASAHAYGLTAALTLAVLSPLLHGRDGFPLSTYPMFSARRPDVAWIARAEGETSSGQARALSPTLVSGSAEPMQAVSTLNRAFASGRAGAKRLCREIAKRATGGEIARVRLERIQVSVLGYFDGEGPRAVTPMATCTVGSPTP